MKDEVKATGSKPPPRVDYDDIAHLYDSLPYRDKEVDPAFLEFLNTADGNPLSVLDMGCGTGNQLVANRPHMSQGRMVGMDLFRGMLRQATPKADTIHWIQANSTLPPFADGSFDFITNQYSFHHVHDKPGMLQSVFRILRPGGRFVMSNIDPHRQDDWLIYKYFPATLEADMQDFLSESSVLKLLREAGFHDVSARHEMIRFDTNLRDVLKEVQRRDSCSQLITIPDEAYQAGIRRIEEEIVNTGDDLMRPNGVCLLTIQAEKAQELPEKVEQNK